MKATGLNEEVLKVLPVPSLHRRCNPGSFTTSLNLNLCCAGAVLPLLAVIEQVVSTSRHGAHTKEGKKVGHCRPHGFAASLSICMYVYMYICIYMYMHFFYVSTFFCCYSSVLLVSGLHRALPGGLPDVVVSSAMDYSGEWAGKGGSQVALVHPACTAADGSR